MPIKTIIAATFAIALGAGAASAATITAVSNGAVIATPSSVTNAAPTSINVVSAFNEKSGVMLTSALAVNGGSIAVGTKVDSHMLFFNRVGNGGGKPNDSLTAGFSFSEQILGFITATSALNATDSLLGAVGTTYQTFRARGFEGNDSVSLIGTNGLTTSLSITQPGDWFRVVTVAAPAPVPLPAAAPLLLAAIGSVVALRRRRKAA
ncbi:MAG: VPLPA-CTERM sorting domain-containing protein [Jannaschia sp.]